MYQLTQVSVFTGPGGPSGVQGQAIRALLDFGPSYFQIASEQQTPPGVQTATVSYSTSGTTFLYQAVCPSANPGMTIAYTATPQAFVVFAVMGNQTAAEVYAHL
jgi:hypothetical protein